MNQQSQPAGPTIPVEIWVDGKRFVEQMEVNMDGLAAAIVERALKFTDAADRGDEAGRLLEKFSDDDDILHEPEVAGLMQASAQADDDYNAEKARLFALCRLLVAANAAANPVVSAA